MQPILLQLYGGMDLRTTYSSFSEKWNLSKSKLASSAEQAILLANERQAAAVQVGGEIGSYAQGDYGGYDSKYYSCAVLQAV